jgi:hypothetical protein
MRVPKRYVHGSTGSAPVGAPLSGTRRQPAVTDADDQRVGLGWIIVLIVLVLFFVVSAIAASRLRSDLRGGAPTRQTSRNLEAAVPEPMAPTSAPTAIIVAHTQYG